jgi:hypothetical protein
MRIENQPVHCLACKHEWLAEMIFDAPIKVCAAAIKELRCPSCGVGPKQIAFGRGDVPDPQPIQIGMTDSEKRAAWLKLHDNGLSSECIAEVMCGMKPSGDHPWDGDDFGRCERLLILYPEWRARLDEMRKVSPIWNTLVKRWNEIVIAWRHDAELYKRQPRARTGWMCYPLMQSIVRHDVRPTP